MKSKRVLGVLSVLLALAFAVTSCGDDGGDYPDSAITMMVPFTEGGGTDRQARSLATILEAELGQPVNVINNPGAGGTVGAQELLASDPDGLTIMFAVSTAVTTSPIINELDYTVDDFTVAGITSTFQTAIVTRGDAPFQTWGEFVDYARENPGLTFASLGPDSALAINQIAEVEGFEINVVPAGGGANLAPLLQSGDVDLGFSGGIHSRFLDADSPQEQMVVLASMNSTGPLTATPDAPSTWDVYGIATDVQGGFLVPADTPEDIVETLAAAIEVAADDPAYEEVLAGLQFPKTFTGYPDAQAVWKAQADGFSG